MFPPVLDQYKIRFGIRDYDLISVTAYLEVKRDHINRDWRRSGVVLKSSCEETLREEKSRDPKHLEINRKS